MGRGWARAYLSWQGLAEGLRQGRCHPAHFMHTNALRGLWSPARSRSPPPTPGDPGTPAEPAGSGAGPAGCSSELSPKRKGPEGGGGGAGGGENCLAPSLKLQ